MDQSLSYPHENIKKQKDYFSANERHANERQYTQIKAKSFS